MESKSSTGNGTDPRADVEQLIPSTLQALYSIDDGLLFIEYTLHVPISYSCGLL